MRYERRLAALLLAVLLTVLPVLTGCGLKLSPAEQQEKTKKTPVDEIRGSVVSSEENTEEDAEEQTEEKDAGTAPADEAGDAGEETSGAQAESFSWEDHRTTEEMYINEKVGLRFVLPGSGWSFSPEDRLKEIWDEAVSVTETNSLLSAVVEKLSVVDMEASSENGSDVRILFQNLATIERLDKSFDRSTYSDEIIKGFAEGVDTKDMVSVTMKDRYDWEMAGQTWSRQDLVCTYFGFLKTEACILFRDVGDWSVVIAMAVSPLDSLTMDELLAFFGSPSDPMPQKQEESKNEDDLSSADAEGDSDDSDGGITVETLARILGSTYSWDMHKTEGSVYISDIAELKIELPGEDWSFTPDEELRAAWRENMSVKVDLTDLEGLAENAGQLSGMVFVDEMGASSESGSFLRVQLMNAALFHLYLGTDADSRLLNMLAGAIVDSLSSTGLVEGEVGEQTTDTLAGKEWLRQDLSYTTMGLFESSGSIFIREVDGEFYILYVIEGMLEYTYSTDVILGFISPFDGTNP